MAAFSRAAARGQLATTSTEITASITLGSNRILRAAKLSCLHNQLGKFTNNYFNYMLQCDYYTKIVSKSLELFFTKQLIYIYLTTLNYKQIKESFCQK